MLISENINNEQRLNAINESNQFVPIFEAKNGKIELIEKELNINVLSNASEMSSVDNKFYIFSDKSIENSSNEIKEIMKLLIKNNLVFMFYHFEPNKSEPIYVNYLSIIDGTVKF